MKFYVYKLIAPRPTFALDMTPAERELMRSHVGYWRELMQRGWVVVFGPVVDPADPHGLGVIRLPDDADPQAIGRDDPCLKANVGFKFHVAPMAQAVVAPGI